MLTRRNPAPRTLERPRRGPSQPSVEATGLPRRWAVCRLGGSYQAKERRGSGRANFGTSKRAGSWGRHKCHVEIPCTGSRQTRDTRWWCVLLDTDGENKRSSDRLVVVINECDIARLVGSARKSASSYGRGPVASSLAMLSRRRKTGSISSLQDGCYIYGPLQDRDQGSDRPHRRQPQL